MSKRSLGRWRSAEILFSPYAIALLITVAIILLIPPVFEKYKVELTHSGPCHKPGSIEEYIDLNSDGYGERIVLFRNRIGVPALKVLSHDDITIDQWNFSGQFPDKKGFAEACDMDKDGLKEIYIFTIKEDTLFLNAISPFSDDVELFRNKYITNIFKVGDTVHLHIENMLAHDMNGDGYDELVFNVEAGFSRQPRAIFAYDHLNDSIWQSMSYGANVGQLLIEDINDDGQPEIICACNTLGNIHDSINIPYHDYASYLMVFDHRLQLLFEPLAYNVYPSSVYIAMVRLYDPPAIAALFRNNSTDSTPSSLKVVAADGHVFRNLDFSRNDPLLGKLNKLASPEMVGAPHAILILGEDGIIALDTSLQPQENNDLRGLTHPFAKCDLDNDGSAEILFWDMENNLVITQEGFRDPVYLLSNFNSLLSSPYSISFKQNGNDNPEIFIKTGSDFTYYYGFDRNPMYYLKYPLWILIYLGSLLLMILIKYTLKIQLERKMAIENQINALQLKTIKSQMDPHFMFNALNSIAISIRNGDNDTAYSFTVKYSNLLRSLFSKADQLSVKLEEELSFVKQYLEIEQFRFNNSFTYSVNIDPEVNMAVEIPRMLLQLFVENAIKHGLQHKDGRGSIQIDVTRLNGMIEICVQDDGIGRLKAGKYKTGSGMGSKIINEMISLFERTKGVSISYSYHDLYEEGRDTAGTLVKILVPAPFH